MADSTMDAVLASMTGLGVRLAADPVSYTHLTLPTKA